MEKLAEPLSWRSPRLVFVNSMSEPGHYIHKPSGAHVWDRIGPWADYDLDAPSYRDSAGRLVVTGEGFCPPDPKETQGVWRLRQDKDASGETWSAIGCWDRTVDRRGACKAVFVARGEHDEAAMREVAAAAFPSVWARIVGAR